MLIYEIYIKTFNKSTPKCEFGDLKGVISKVNYLKWLGVDAIWITPFYPSPLIDNGYDVSDYVNVDERLGTLDDFNKLIKVYHDNGIKVIIDVVFNHTSDQHVWFKKALNGDEKYMDYYVFRDQPANNWESMFKGSVWSYAPEVNKYYLHRFAKEQPDLNFANETLVQEILNILDFWLNMDVDGFRFDVINFLISDLDLIDHDNGDTRVDLDMDKTYDVIRKLNTHIKSQKKDTILIGEIGSDDINVLSTYVGEALMDFVFTFNVSSMDEFDPEKLTNELIKTYSTIEMPTIFFSSHDMSRFYRRLANYDEDVYLMILELVFALKGHKVLFQGDESMQKDYVPTNIDQMHDIQSINEYNLLLENGESSDNAFEKAMMNNRDFSRNFVDFSNVSAIEKATTIIKRYDSGFYNYADIKDIKFSDNVISFIRYTNEKEVKFKFDFENKTIGVLHETIN